MTANYAVPASPGPAGSVGSQRGSSLKASLKYVGEGAYSDLILWFTFPTENLVDIRVDTDISESWAG